MYNGMKTLFEGLQGTIQKIKELLELDTAIDEKIYFEIVGTFSKELKLLLTKYFESDEETQTKMRPFLNYYRQLQHYLVYIIRYPTILEVPHHSEILQTLSFIENQEKLIKEKYLAFSEAQKELLNGEFMKVLDDFYKLKLEGKKEE